MGGVRWGLEGGEGVCRSVEIATVIAPESRGAGWRAGEHRIQTEVEVRTCAVSVGTKVGKVGKVDDIVITFGVEVVIMADFEFSNRGQLRKRSSNASTTFSPPAQSHNVSRVR